jgi:hypothetical protein
MAEKTKSGLASIPSVYRMFTKDMLSNLLGIDQTKEDLTEDFFLPEELNAMKNAINESRKRDFNYYESDPIHTDTTFRSQYESIKPEDVIKRAHAKKGSVFYEDYPGPGGLEFEVFTKTPESSVNKTLGQFNWYVNDRGETVIEDQYDFEGYDMEEFREEFPTTLDKIKFLFQRHENPDTGELQLFYPMARKTAAILGSTEASGEGQKFNVNLGELPDYPIITTDDTEPFKKGGMIRNPYPYEPKTI